jgi:hypothetical protein
LKEKTSSIFRKVWSIEDYMYSKLLVGFFFSRVESWTAWWLGQVLGKSKIPATSEYCTEVGSRDLARTEVDHPYLR